jgi:17beta-estradiol 17-dehydrogenase / very-long-chain 3-oxoacyl-CoA reductase
VEYKSKGIDVQYQVPFYVHTRMLSSAVKARLRPWFVATADEYTRTAARWIGNGPLCVPGAAQKLQWCLTGFVPDWAHDWYRIRLHLQHRAVTRAAHRRRAAAVASGDGSSPPGQAIAVGNSVGAPSKLSD